MRARIAGVGGWALEVGNNSLEDFWGQDMVQSLMPHLEVCQVASVAPCQECLGELLFVQFGRDALHDLFVPHVEFLLLIYAIPLRLVILGPLDFRGALHLRSVSTDTLHRARGVP